MVLNLFLIDIVDGKFGSFAQLSYSIYQSLTFLDISKLDICPEITSSPDFLTNNTVDHILSLSPYCKGLISTLYNNMCYIIPHSLQDVRRLWENNPGEEMTDDQWEAVLDLALTLTQLDTT